MGPARGLSPTYIFVISPAHSNSPEPKLNTFMATSLLSFLHSQKPLVSMVIARLVYAGSSILIKVAGNQGMNMKILIAYGYIFAAACIAPIAFLVERNERPKMTWIIVFQAFLCGLFGQSLAENLMMESLANTSATICIAITSLVPAITFLLGIIFRLERLEITTLAGQAKLFGTILCLGGAMLLTFYKGIQINHGLTHINFHKHAPPSQNAKVHNGSEVLGSLFAVGFCISVAVWLILQAKMSKKYPCQFSSTALTCAAAAMQSTIYALFMEKDWSLWKLHFNVGLLTAIYTGVLGSGLMVVLIAWCLRIKGPLYVSMFYPLTLIFVAIADLMFLNEKLYLGSIFGAAVIVIGLYALLWGNSRSSEKQPSAPSTCSAVAPDANASHGDNCSDNSTLDV